MKQRHTSCHSSSTSQLCLVHLLQSKLWRSHHLQLAHPSPGNWGHSVAKKTCFTTEEKKLWIEWNCKKGWQFGALSESLNTCRLSFSPVHKQGTAAGMAHGDFGRWETRGKERLMENLGNSEQEGCQDGDGGTTTISTTCSKLEAKSGFSFLICVAAFTGPPPANLIA